MSSTSSTKPVHRLVFDGMTLTLFAPDGRRPLVRADLAAPDMARQVAEFAAAAEGSQGLVAVLPEVEIWRGSVRLASRTPWGRRAEALAEAEAAMGVGGDALDLIIGPRAPDGTTPVAAIRRQSVIDTLVFLDRNGLRATALTGAGDFPGFAAAPLFRIGGRDWPAGAVAFVSNRARRLPPLTRPRALAASAAAAALLLLGVLVSGGDDPAPPPVAAAPDVPEVIFPVADAREAAPAETAPAVLMIPAAPRARPADLPSPAPMTDRIDAALVPLPPALRPDGPADTRPVTIASRTTPVVPSARMAARPTDLTLAETPTARARGAAPVSDPPIAAEDPAGTVSAESGPLRRAEPPQVSEPAVAKVSAPVPLAAGTRPKPRSTSVTPEALAETVRAALETAVAPEETEAPLATARMLPAAPPEPRRIVAAAPKPASSEPIAVRAAVLAASVAPPVKAVAAPVAKPAPVAVAKPAPVAVAKAAPVAKPAPIAQKAAPASNRAASERIGLSRSNLSLLGVFGSSNDRYALLRLPNGSVKRVGAGDSFQGVQVAAVSGDAVRLTQGQRDTVLRMPD